MTLKSLVEIGELPMNTEVPNEFRISLLSDTFQDIETALIDFTLKVENLKMVGKMVGKQVG